MENILNQNNSQAKILITKIFPNVKYSQMKMFIKSEKHNWRSNRPIPIKLC